MGKSKRAIAAAKKKAAKEKAKMDKKKSGTVKDVKTEQTEEEKAEAAASYRMATGVLVSRPTARDVKIDAFSLMAYGRELIKDTLLELTIGRRYGLIGANGSGKSTMLKCLANREVPIPDHIDLYFLDEEAPPSEMTATEFVIQGVKDEVARLEKQADEVIEEHGPEDPMVQQIYEKLEELNPESFETRAGKLLFGLGFSMDMMKRSTKDMSGGWRMRVALAKALFIRPTLLLLDEPTNHLDLEACVWLEEYLATYPYCLMVISHSQDFLNGVCTNIIDITPQKTLEGYSGNYDTFCKTRGENEVVQLKKFQKEQDDIKHLKGFIASCGTYSNMVKQAKSKQKILDKMMEAGLTPKPGRQHDFNFAFTPCERLAPPVMALQHVSFSYSGKKEDHLYEDLNLGVDLDSRIALVGPNGAGKSTLLKLMVGDISPTIGLVRRHLHMKIGRYHQHSTDQLDNNKTVLDFMRDTYEDPKNRLDDEAWRKAIGRYGISGSQQTQRIGTLSDGLKSRIVFAMLAYEKPNLLLLDEPTNHLDIECIDSLANAINGFNGGLVLVSHDFRLINQVAKEIWVCDNMTVSKWKGDIRSYKAALIKEMRKMQGMSTEKASLMRDKKVSKKAGFKVATL